MTREGRGPVAKPPVMGPAAGAQRGSHTALSKPPTGRCPEPLVDGALCWAEPSITGGWRDLRMKPVRRPAGVRRPTQWPAACAVLDTAPGENSRGACGSSAQGTGAPGEGGWVGQGKGTELPAPPPPPGVHQPALCRRRLLPHPESLTGNVRGWRHAAPRPQGIPNQTKPPLLRHCRPKTWQCSQASAYLTRGPAPSSKGEYLPYATGHRRTTPRPCRRTHPLRKKTHGLGH